MSTISTSDSSLREQLTKEVTWTDSYLRKRNDVISKLRHHIQQEHDKKDTSLFKKSISKYHKTFEASRKKLYEWYSLKTECNSLRRYSSSFKQKVINEVQLCKCKSHIAEKYNLSHQTLTNWIEKASKAIPEIKELSKKKRCPFEFKQKVINEIRLGKSKKHVAEKYSVCYQTLTNWMKKASEAIPETKEPSKRKTYPFEFKQKVINEVRLGMCRFHTAEKYNLPYKTLVGWMRKACLPVRPILEIREPLEEEKYPLDFKQKVVSEVCSGQHISQVCKNYNICQSSLNIWLTKAYSPNFPYNSSAAWIDSRY